MDQIIHSGILSAVFASCELSTGTTRARIVTLLNYLFQSPLHLCQSSSRQSSQYNIYTTIRPTLLFSNLNSLFLILLTSCGWRLARRNRIKERTDKGELVLAALVKRYWRKVSRSQKGLEPATFCTWLVTSTDHPFSLLRVRSHILSIQSNYYLTPHVLLDERAKSSRLRISWMCVIVIVT